MVSDKRKRNVSDANNVQNVGVPSVQQKSGAPGANANDLRLLNGRAVILHYRHLSARRQEDPDCSVCRQGLEGAFTALRPERNGVVQSDGVDKKGDTTPASDGQWDWGKSAELSPGQV